MVAEKTEVAGMILMGPAPTADIFAFYPTMLACFGKHFFTLGILEKSHAPYKKEFFKYCMNEQEEALKEEVFAGLVPESGKFILRWLFIGLIRQRQLMWTLVTFYVLFSSFQEPRIR